VSIRHVILGFLTDASATGYDLKKQFAASQVFHWSGNNNQIYKALVELHDDALVTVELQPQGSKPPRKVYSITDSGRAALRDWLRTPPELPQVRNPLLTRLAWLDQLDTVECDAMLSAYTEDLRLHIQMLREQTRRDARHDGKATPRALRQRVAERWIAMFEQELEWVQALHASVCPGKDTP
jgi:PadR family transcriptional regulator AphA